MTAPSTVPATKPEPVRLLGAVITGLAAITGGLSVIFADNQSVVVVLAIITLVIAAVNTAKDQYVRGQVIPAADVTAYMNEDRQEIAGEASEAPTGAVIQTISAEPAGDLNDPSDPGRNAGG